MKNELILSVDTGSTDDVAGLKIRAGDWCMLSRLLESPTADELFATGVLSNPPSTTRLPQLYFALNCCKCNRSAVPLRAPMEL